MKKLFIIAILMTGIFAGCKENPERFEAPLSGENITFTPIAGGAKMHYRLPKDQNVASILVRYRNAQGVEVLKAGSYACDTLIIDGFNQAESGVTARVSLADRNRVETSPIELKFDTRDSGPYSFFNQAKVVPYWEGFSVTYVAPPMAEGLAHVFYVGTDQTSQKESLISVGEIRIEGGQREYRFVPKQVKDSYTVVIRTEDYLGYMVKEQRWENVPAYHSHMLTQPGNFEFLDIGSKSIESASGKTGISYLFDGDTKGEQAFRDKGTNMFYCFVAGPEAKNTPYLIDFGEKAQSPAYLRFYGMLYVRDQVPGGYVSGTPNWGSIWDYGYYNKLPSAVTIYASNNKDDESSWVKIGSYSEPRDALSKDRWSAYCQGMDDARKLKTIEAIKAADPCFLTVSFAASNTTYRYLKIVIDELFDKKEYSSLENSNEYMTLYELEVYVKK